MEGALSGVEGALRRKDSQGVTARPKCTIHSANICECLLCTKQ